MSYENLHTILQFENNTIVAGMSAPFKEHKQKELRELIMEVLWRNPKLNYYQVNADSSGVRKWKGSLYWWALAQGFHDICACFLLVLGKRDAIPAAENVALFFLRYPFFQAICSCIDLRITNQMVPVPNHFDFDLSQYRCDVGDFRSDNKAFELDECLVGYGWSTTTSLSRSVC